MIVFLRHSTTNLVLCRISIFRVVLGFLTRNSHFLFFLLLLFLLLFLLFFFHSFKDGQFILKYNNYWQRTIPTQNNWPNEYSTVQCPGTIVCLSYTKPILWCPMSRKLIKTLSSVRKKKTKVETSKGVVINKKIGSILWL